MATGHLVPADTHLFRQYRSSPVSVFCRVFQPCFAHSRCRWTVESAVQKVFCCSRRTTFCESGLLRASSPVLFSYLRSFTGYDPYPKRSCWASTGSGWSFLHLRWRFQEIRSCIRLLECPAAMLDSVTGLSPTVSSRALLFSPTHKRAPFYVRSSNPRAWDELCYWPPSYTGTLRRHSRSSKSSIFAILLSAFLRLRLLLSTEAGLGSRTRMIRLQLLGLQLSAPCLAAGLRSPCWCLRRDARRPPR